MPQPPDTGEPDAEPGSPATDLEASFRESQQRLEAGLRGRDADPPPATPLTPTTPPAAQVEPPPAAAPALPAVGASAPPSPPPAPGPVAEVAPAGQPPRQVDPARADVVDATARQSATGGTSGMGELERQAIEVGKQLEDAGRDL